MANAKTLRKRIALVAAAAVGVGMLVAAPASAVAGLTSVTTYAGSGTTTTTSVSTAVGTAVNVAWYATTAGTPGASDVVTYTPTVTNKPGDSGLAVTTASSATAATSGQVALNYGAGTAVTGWTEAASTNAVTDTVAGSPANLSAANRGNVSINPDKPGVYTITITTTSAAGTGSTAVITVYAGFDADSAHTHTAFAAQGTKTDTAFTAVPGGFATARFMSFTAATHYYVTVSGATLTSATPITGNTSISKTSTFSAGINFTNGTNLSGGVDFWASTAVAADGVDIQVQSSTAGSATITVSSVNASTGVLTTFSAPVVTYVAVAGYSAGRSSVLGSPSTTTPTTTTDGYVIDAPIATGTVRANYSVNLNDSTGTAYTGQTVSVTVSGPGLLAYSNTQGTTSVGTARTLSFTSTGGRDTVSLASDGTTGVTTLTFAVTDKVSGATTTLATKTVNFYGTTATLTAAAIVSAISTTGTAVRVTAKDANGTPVRGATISGASTNDASLVSGWTCSERDATAANAYPGQYNCAPSALTGIQGSVSASFKDNQTTPIVSNAATFLVTSGTIAAISIAFDKATYGPGEKATLTITATNAAGNGVADDGTYTSLHTFSSNLSTSTTWPTGAAFGISGNGSKAGQDVVTVYMPATAGTFTVTDLLGSTGVAAALAATKITASAQVVVAADAGVAAAKAAADAATAAVATLSTTVAALVASITAQIKALSVLVAKIMKKLGIK